MSTSLSLSLAKCKRMLTTLSSMAAVNALSFKDCPVRKQLVLGVSKLLQVDLSAKDISVSHRLYPASESNRQPTIIARFCSRRIRDAVFTNRHRLRAHNKDHPKARIFINESLTKINRRRSTSAYVSKRRINSSSYGQRME